MVINLQYLQLDIAAANTAMAMTTSGFSSYASLGWNSSCHRRYIERLLRGLLDDRAGKAYR